MQCAGWCGKPSPNEPPSMLVDVVEQRRPAPERARGHQQAHDRVTQAAAQGIAERVELAVQQADLAFPTGLFLAQQLIVLPGGFQLPGQGGKFVETTVQSAFKRFDVAPGRCGGV